MTSFDHAIKPSWLRSYQGLLDISQHHLFIPKDLGELTTLTDASGFNRGLKQFLYWKGQLLPSCGKTTVFLAFLGHQGLALKNVANVLKALRPICNLSLLQETYTGANLNFLALSFSEESPVLDIVKKFIFFDNCVVLPIVFRGDNTHRFWLLWLPPMFDVARVHHLLSQFSASHRLKRESISIGEGQYSPTNVISGTITLKSGVSVNQMPHFIRLPSPHKGSALLYIEGRPPLCLKCRDIGHTRRQCSMVRCSTCQMVHFPSSACGASSYSSVATKGLTMVQDDDWLANIADESCHDPSVSSGLNVTSAPHVILGDSEELVVPTSVSLAPSSSDTDLQNTSTHKKCDHTFNILSESTFTSEITPPTFDEFSTGLILKDTEVEQPSPTINSPTIDSESTLKPSSVIFQESHHAPSPPLTRSRASKKCFISSSDHPGNALRSEMVSYTSHSSESIIKASSSSFITTHYKPSKDFITSFDDQMNSSASDIEVTYSDIEVDLSLRETSQDVSSRKRKSAGLVHTDDGSSSCEGDSQIEIPLIVSVSSPTSTISADFSATAGPLHDTPDVVLLDEDKRVASLFSLSPSDLLSIKAACPGNVFSVLNIKKLSVLHKHSIPLLPVINHPQFFSLSPSVVTKRIKILERHSSSIISVADLLQMSSSYEIIQGLPVIMPTPKLCSDDPFNINS